MIKVAIVGAGSIGANKSDDIDFSGSENILTHANAIDRHMKTELIAIVDPDTEQLKKAKIKWHPKECFSTIEQMYAILQDNSPDIIIVSSPTETHYQTLNDIIKFSGNNKPKIVVAEKPFCNNSKEAKTISNIYEENNIKICVDYIRRFSMGHQIIEDTINNKKFGEVQNCRVLYTRGLKRDGCHAIDLMNWFFGKCTNYIQILGKPVIDYDKNDATANYQLCYDKCDNVIFQGCDGRKYGIFEIDICFEKGRIRLIDNGLFFEIYPITDINEWAHAALNYSLTSVIRQETGLNLSLYNLLNNCVKNIIEKETLKCTDQDALQVHNIFDKLGV